MALAYVALVNREALVSRRLQVGDCEPSIGDCEPSIGDCEPSIKVMPAMAQCPRLVSAKRISNIRRIPVTSNRVASVWTTTSSPLSLQYQIVDLLVKV